MEKSEASTSDESRRDELAFLESLRRSLAIGFCRNLQAKIDRFGARLAASSDSDIRSAYAAIREKAENAFRIELVHGTGSLLRLRHRIVKDLIGIEEPRVPPIITSGEIEAARRYRSIRG